MAAIKPRIKLPKKARKNDVITIKTLIRHRMESGHRKDSKTGQKVPRMIINTFTATFNGVPVFSADFETAVAANPYLSFTAKIPESGIFQFTWVDDEGTVYQAEREITVEE